MSKLKKTVIAALLLAIMIISDRFLSFNTTFFTINLSFIPALITAILLGPVYSMLIFGLSDYIGAHLFPFGEYFVGFTISAVIKGLIYGIFLYPGLKEKFVDTKIGQSKFGKVISNILLTKEAKVKRFTINLIISSIIVRFIVNVFLQALWLNILFGKAYLAIIPTRFVTQLGIFIIQIIVIPAIYNILRKEIDKYLEEE